jgi:hypothetical protein
VALEAVDAALDGVALPVDLRIEGGWPATGGILGAAAGVLVGFAEMQALIPRRRR